MKNFAFLFVLVAVSSSPSSMIKGLSLGPATSARQKTTASQYTCGDRRKLFPAIPLAFATAAVTMLAPSSLIGACAFEPSQQPTREGRDIFQYSGAWAGTKLPLRNLADLFGDKLVSERTSNASWEMGRWPDPILRRPASEVDAKWYGTAELESAAITLAQTARREGAVGLAAQQCGIDARMVYLEGYGVLVNPHILQRSPETASRVWQERCLVLPPTFVATVLRDDWVVLEYHTPRGNRKSMRLQGEASRCIQHEMDHDRGILVTDHVGLEDMENDLMRALETPGHNERMMIAYDRRVDLPEEE